MQSQQHESLIKIQAILILKVTQFEENICQFNPESDSIWRKHLPGNLCISG